MVDRLIITVTVGHDDDIYKWESTNPKAIALDVVGFAMIACSVLVNESRITFFLK